MPFSHKLAYYTNILFAYSMMNFHQNRQWSYKLNIDAFTNVQSKSNEWSWHWTLDSWVYEGPNSPTKTPNSHLCHCPGEIAKLVKGLFVIIRTRVGWVNLLPRYTRVNICLTWLVNVFCYLFNYLTWLINVSDLSCLYFTWLAYSWGLLLPKGG
jgi:hypothetical protein